MDLQTWPEVDPDDIPGSRPRVEHKPVEQPPPPERPWDAYPKEFRVNGVTMQLYDVSALAQALGRDTTTIYSWERKGWFPITDLRSPRRGQTTLVTKQKITVDLKGRRLYTREFIEGCIRIAAETGVSVPGADIAASGFPERVFDLWEDCKV